MLTGEDSLKQSRGARNHVHFCTAVTFASANSLIREKEIRELWRSKKNTEFAAVERISEFYSFLLQLRWEKTGISAVYIYAELMGKILTNVIERQSCTSVVQGLSGN